ncbi:MAG: hypothetical protein O2897_00185 [bacterium]|nr:hypothetical protein [bacterium]
MGILSGSSTYLRFKIEGEVPSGYLELFEKSINMRRFVPLHVDGEDTESIGWVSFQKPYDDDAEIFNDNFLFNESIVLGYREDSISYPMKDWIRKRLEEFQEKNQSVASWQTKKSIEAAVVGELRKRILPKSKVINFAWDISRGELRFFARGKSIADRFISHFEQTFQLKINLISFADLALRTDMSLMDKSLLETLEPQEIFKIIARTEVN